MPQNSSQGWPTGSPGARAGCQGSFIWEGTVTGKPPAAACLQRERRHRTGLVGLIRSAPALYTPDRTDTLPKHLAGNKPLPVHQSCPAAQPAGRWPSLTTGVQLASSAPRAVWSESTGEHQHRHCYLLWGQATQRQQLLSCALRQSATAWGNLARRKGNSLTYVAVSTFNWQPEIKVSCGSKDRERVGGKSAPLLDKTL